MATSSQEGVITMTRNNGSITILLWGDSIELGDPETL
jgi:hypothetical protein